MSTISDDRVVSLRYTLKDEADEVLEVVEPDAPLLYLHGWGNIVTGLEEELEDLEAGETYQIVVAPEDGYGERLEVEPQVVPRSSFPEDMPMEPGLGIAGKGPGGQHVTLYVLRVEGDEVVVDLNHPFAGKTLHYDVEVLEVRDATEEELQQGHPQGMGDYEGGASED